jgi:hypothetical protein
MVKGAILSEIPDINIIDISNEVAKYDILQAAFIIKNAYRSFPEGSIHIIGVNPQKTVEACHLVIKADGHYFIGSDNGMFSLIFDKIPDKIFEITIPPDGGYRSFPTNDVFTKAACHIARGGTLEIIGKKKGNYQERIMIRPVVDGAVLKGSIIYIDSYENLITNIGEDLFNEAARGRNFTIFIKHSGYHIKEIAMTYNEVPEGEMLALFSAAGYLEIAINMGSANGLLGLQLGDTVRVEFE